MQIARVAGSIAGERGLRRTSAALALVLGLVIFPREAVAQCSSTAPANDQTVTCTGTETAGVIGQTSTGVTVDVQAGASVSRSTAGPTIDLGRGATINVAAGANVVSTGNQALIPRNGSASVTIAGTVSSTADTMYFTPGSGGQNTLNIASGGSLTSSGTNAMAATGAAATDITVAGTLSGGSNAAILTSNGDVFRLHATGVVTGLVQASLGTDSFVLAGSANAFFDASRIGASAQFRQFELFVKQDASRWTLTGTGNQNWSVTGGTLQGDTTSLQGNISNAAVVAFSQSLNGTYAGTISGAGSLSKLDNGELILTGANNYTGGTTVTAGTLTGTTTSLQGNIANAATLNFDQATNGTFSGSISGAGTVRKNGAGTLTLTGAQPMTGQLQALGGTLVLNGSTQGDVAVAGGTFGGDAQIDGLLAFGGTVAPGNSIGTLTVNGPVSFNGANYAVEIDASGASDQILATGAATLNSVIVSILPAAGAYAAATNYTILSAAGGVTGTFGSTSMNGGFAFLQPSLLYVGNDVILRILNLNIAPEDGGGAAQVTFESVANTGNERAVARTLDALGTEAPFYEQLLVQTAPGARDAYNALSGEMNASLPTAAIAPSGLLTGWLHDRLSGVAPSPTGGPLMLASAPIGIVSAGALASSFEAGGARIDPALPGVGSGTDATEAPYSAWMHAFGDLTHVASDGDAAAVDSSGGGLFLGGDIPVGSWLRIGAATGYSHGNVSVGARSSSADLDGAHAALYGTAAFGPVRLRAVGSFAYQGIDTRRRVQIGNVTEHPTADYGSTVAGGLGELGYAFDVSGLEIQPYAGVDYVSLHTDAFTEEDGGQANLDVDAATDDWPTSVLGVRLARDFTYAGHVFRPRIDAAWGHTFGTLAPERAAAFASAPGLPFSVSGASLARDAARIGAGVDVLLTENVRLGLEYRGDLAPGAQGNGFGLKLGVRF